MTDLYVLGIAHPAWIIRGQFSHEPAQIEFLRRAKSIADGEEPKWTNENVGEPAPGYWGCAPDEFHSPRVRQYFDATQAEGYAVDIEAAGPHITFIGFCSLETEQGLGVRFRGAEGVQVWSAGELETVLELVYDVLASPEVPLWFHNGVNYDVWPQLEGNGFVINGFAGDTMLLATATYSEMPRGLEFLSTLWCGIPMWKYLVDEKDMGETK